MLDILYRDSRTIAVPASTAPHRASSCLPLTPKPPAC